MTTNAVLWGISLVYFLAFASLYIQLPSIVGDDGVSPVRLLDLSAPKNLESFVRGIPSVVRFRDSLKLGAYHATELLVVIGLILSFLSMASSALRGTLSLIIQWIAFLSVVKVCPPLADWTWTIMLIEAGFLCILLSIKLRTCKVSASSGIIIWLMRWLLFRSSVTMGFTKLSRSAYNWWDLSCMEHYFTDQLSPTAASFYVEIIPNWILRLFSVTVLVMELAVPFLFFIPISGLQMFAFMSQFMLHANMLLTGNYGIYNVLCVVLSFALLPQHYKKQKKQGMSTKLASMAITLAVLGVMAYGVWFIFGFSGGVKAIRIVLHRSEFVVIAKQVVYYTVPVAAGLFGLAILCAIYRALRTNGCMNKMLEFTGVVLVGLMGVCLFAASIAPFANLTDSGSIVPLPRAMHEISAGLKPFHLANDYRYAHERDANVFMKSSPAGRTTLVIEAGMSDKGPWKEVSFFHAPGRLDKFPGFIPGHHPVLDFEMSLFGSTTFDNSPLLASIVYRILSNEQSVMQQMEPLGLKAAPKYVQIKKYNYNFGDALTPGSNWWTRKLQSVYLPPVDITAPRVVKLVEKAGIAGKRRERPSPPNAISTALDQLRAMIGQQRDLRGFYVVVAVVFIMNKLFF